MDDLELIKEQRRQIRNLEMERDLIRQRVIDMKAELDYICEYLNMLRKNINKHMSNPKLYPKEGITKQEH
jgi:uncharacterized coiled-coil DUF342 family protein